eukprot:3159206-Rhodomonas_salina.1
MSGTDIVYAAASLHCYAMSGTDLLCGTSRHATLRDVRAKGGPCPVWPIRLRTRYAMSGTDIAYSDLPTHAPCPVLSSLMRYLPMHLRCDVRYCHSAMSGTDVAGA